MQMVAKDMARRYNQGAPPKPVDFLHAFVIEALTRSLNRTQTLEP